MKRLAFRAIESRLLIFVRSLAWLQTIVQAIEPRTIVLKRLAFQAIESGVSTSMRFLAWLQTFAQAIQPKSAGSFRRCYTMIIEVPKGFVSRASAARLTSTFTTAALRPFQLCLYSRFHVFQRLCILAFGHFTGFAIGSFAGLLCLLLLLSFSKQSIFGIFRVPPDPPPR